MVLASIEDHTKNNIEPRQREQKASLRLHAQTCKHCWHLIQANPFQASAPKAIRLQHVQQYFSHLVGKGWIVDVIVQLD